MPGERFGLTPRPAPAAGALLAFAVRASVVDEAWANACARTLPLR